MKQLHTCKFTTNETKKLSHLRILESNNSCVDACVVHGLGNKRLGGRGGGYDEGHSANFVLTFDVSSVSQQKWQSSGFSLEEALNDKFTSRGSQ